MTPGIAVGIAGLGAIFQHHAGTGGPASAAAVAAALTAIFLVAAAVTVAGALASWPLLWALRPEAA